MLYSNVFALEALQEYNNSMEEVLTNFDASDIEQMRYFMERIKLRTDGTLVFDDVLMVLWVVVIGFMTLITRRIIVKPIKKANDELQNIIKNIKENNGDLTVRIHTKNVDEIGEFVDGINLFIEELQNIISHIKNNSAKIKESAKTINNKVVNANESILNVSSVSEELSAGVEETTATLEQLSTNSNHILNESTIMSDNAVKKSEDMLKIKDKAEMVELSAKEGKNNSIESINQLTEILHKAIEDSKSVEQIGELTNEILDITNQTNLLSLNASIEAAHAGQYGRGFAVVADEIRKLSENSRATANNIQQVNDVVGTAVGKLVDSATKMIELINTSIVEDYNKFEEVAHQYKQDAEYMSKVLNEFSEQSNVIKETMLTMNNGLNDITLAMEDSSNGITSVATDISELANAMVSIKEESSTNEDISNQLENEVSRFKNV